MPYQAQSYYCFDSIEQLVRESRQNALFARRHLILGGGSNSVFTQDFDGAVIRLTADKITLSEDEDYYYLSVESGHNWHRLVQWCMDKGLYGLENLALIPGNVGAAPIQNIGAYGVEFESVCDFVEYLDKQSGELVKVGCEQLQLGYRDSVFKHALKDKVVITLVGLKLKKCWQAVNHYHGLSGLETPQAIYEGVIRERRRKLPDHEVLPNAGSFFKNPIVAKVKTLQLQQQYPNMPVYSVDDETRKLSAAWLIEQCGLKGYREGGIGVYQHHALILVNHGDGTGEQLRTLIETITCAVEDKFEITLECEVQVI